MIRNNCANCVHSLKTGKQDVYICDYSIDAMPVFYEVRRPRELRLSESGNMVVDFGDICHNKIFEYCPKFIEELYD